MNLPAMHASHAPCPVCGCTVPGAQGVATAAPVEQKEPVGQMEHCVLLLRPRELLKLPSGHGSGVDAPASQYAAASHSKHAVCPLAFMKRPASHLSQVPCSGSACAVPGLHGVASCERDRQNAPAGHARQSSMLVIRT